MAPSQTLKWLESGKGPSEQNVEIEAQSRILWADIPQAVTG